MRTLAVVLACLGGTVQGSTTNLLPLRRLALPRFAPKRVVPALRVNRHVYPRMVVETPTTRSGNDDFDVALSYLASSNELQEVRRTIPELERLRVGALYNGDLTRAGELRNELERLRTRDPSYLGSTIRELMQAALEEGRSEAFFKYHGQLRILRRLQPEYNLAGLWKAVYPNGGTEIVRIRYEDEQLLATKLTGDAHVPAGEVTFRVNTSQPHEGGDLASFEWELGPGAVNTISSEERRRGLDQKLRFVGEGMIARKNFTDARFVPGLLYLQADDIIYFLWAPLGMFVPLTRQTYNDEDSP